MQIELSPRLQEATNTLRENLLASKAFIQYQQTYSRLQTDSEANTLLEKLTQAQARLRQKQAKGAVAQADIEELREIQTQVQHNRVIMDYAKAQQEAINFLREINTEISQYLGMNFAVLAQKSTC